MVSKGIVAISLTETIGPKQFRPVKTKTIIIFMFQESGGNSFMMRYSPKFIVLSFCGYF